MPLLGKNRLRWLGIISLAVALLSLILGITLFQPYLAGRVFLVYWLLCFLFTFMAIYLAIKDLKRIAKDSHDEQKQLLMGTLQDIKDSIEHKRDKESEHDKK